MKSKRSSLLVLLAALITLPALAQPGPQENGPRQSPGFKFNRDNTPGWSMMSRQEHAAHRDKMLSLKTLDECKAYMAEHRESMQARAKKRGRQIRGPNVDACDRMMSRGLLK